jgi:dihydrofolate reductase
MRKIIVLSFITLDGVMQAPGGPEEDTSGGFKYGGWQFRDFDPFIGKVMEEQTGHSFDLLLGRKTYEIFRPVKLEPPSQGFRQQAFGSQHRR